MNMNISRRGFIKSSATGAAVLAVGLNSKGLFAAGPDNTVENPFVRIDAEGRVTVVIKHFEMGQGTTTGLATLVAEELDTDWEELKTEFAPSDNARYKNLFWGIQGTGGSSAIANSFMQYRTAGASARDLMVRAAAKKWKVAENSITIDKGIISSGNKKGSFKDFVSLASTLEPNDKPALKEASDFKLIGNPLVGRKDNVQKTTGTASFSIDVKVPGMLYVVILRSPKFGGKLKSFDKSAASKVAGFVDAIAFPNGAGVAVYAKGTWAALEAKKAIKAEWDFSEAENKSTDELVKIHHELAENPEVQAYKDNTTEKISSRIKSAHQTIEADFTFPFLAHATMEPLGCMIEPTSGGGVLLHDGCQIPGIVHGTLSAVLKLPPEKISINTLFTGGSFGRRGTPDAHYQVEAAIAFDLMGRKKPLKLVWSREDDLSGGYYRPMVAHRARIGLDKDGAVLGWDHRLAAKSIMAGTAFEAFAIKDGIDSSLVEGVHNNLYNIPHMSLGVSYYKTPVPVLWWRSVEHTHTAYVMETLMDMVAHARGADPIEMRLEMLGDDPRQKRLAGVLKAVRKLSGWKRGDKRGVAAHLSFNSYVAVVADVSAEGNKVHVNKLYMAVDCGVAVNPDVIKAQMEGGAGYGLGAMLRNEVNFDKGLVVEQNFPEYMPLRISDMPEVEVVIVPSTEAPTGVGEPGLPPTGPAVANAIFARTGKRVTTLPLTKSGFEIV